MGNGYLMHLTNREELRARRQAGSARVAAARVATTPTPASTDVAGPSAPWCRRRSGQHSRQARSERRHAARVASQRDAPTSETAAAPVGERSVSGPRLPIGLRDTTTAYVASVNTNAAMRRVPPGRHILVARDPSASAGDESSQGSTDELPPATSHGYAKWDFSGVPDPVMFRRFLDATDYWFGYSDCKTPDFHRISESLYHRDSPWISGYRVQNVSQIDTQSHTSHHIKLVVHEFITSQLWSTSIQASWLNQSENSTQR
jgi:hypothetical protein